MHYLVMVLASHEEKTGAIYGNLFGGYDDRLFEESAELFFQRHKRWGIDLDWFKNKKCLDAGCGGGRYVVALSRLAVREVVGIDISVASVDITNRRLSDRGLGNGRALVASVLSIPFPDNYFDYVVSTGVIHHTPDPHAAFLEISRVLKPGGKLFLAIYGRGGLKWLTNDIFRYSVCRVIPFPAMENIFRLVGAPANKRYNILDNLYVPYCHRFREEEIRSWFREGGYENIRRLKFERYDYETLRSKIIHGEGWIQIYADKKK